MKLIKAKCFGSLSLSLFAFSAFSQELVLTEDGLLAFSRSQTPEILGLASEVENSKATQGEFRDQFNLRGFGSALYRETHEEPFISFQPVISPQSIFEAGLLKQFDKGIAAKVSVGIDNRKFELTSGVENPSIVTLRAGLEVDLWRNFLGRSNMLEQGVYASEIKQSEIYQNIGQYDFSIQLRSLYWNLIAIDQKIELTRKMHQLAKEQQREAEIRFRNRATDLSAVSLYRSQTATRASEVLLWQFQREQEVKRLKTILPTLKSSVVKLKAPTLELTKDQINQCIAVVEQHEQAPWEYTQYDDLIFELENLRNAKVRQALLYDDPDLKLSGEVFTSAVDPSGIDALGESLTEKRQGFQVMLGVQIPLGKSKTSERKIQVENMNLEKQKIELQQKVITQHEFLRGSIELLVESIRNQNTNIVNMERRIKESRKKYNQGRISLSDFIVDQERLLQSDLALIDNQNLILQTLLSYLSIFSQTPCAFNRISS
ncbi:MAG: TolC family protein [Bdellovibrionales bacterium]|nr:TolC family protein [Bdellovibrionales bacterium]